MLPSRIDEHGVQVKWRVWEKPKEGNSSMRQGPGLNMSRSFGDTRAARPGVVSEPDVKIRKLRCADEVVVLASDGAFEHMSSQKVMNIIDSCGVDAKRAARRHSERTIDMCLLHRIFGRGALACVLYSKGRGLNISGPQVSL